jgi:hypothetical protein
MMKLVWTRSKLPLSRFICWGLNEPVSHMAVVMDQKIAFDASFSGADWNGYKKHFEGREVVFELECELGSAQEELVYDKLNEVEGSRYDYTAFAYFLFRATLYRLFKIAMPTRNKWSVKRAYLCVGVMSALPGSVTMGVDFKNAEILSPYKIYLALTAARAKAALKALEG